MKTNKITAGQMANRIPCDQCTLSKGIYTVRRGFFYKHGKSSEDYKVLVMAQAPANAIFHSCGEVWKPFIGGAPVARQSHWWVKFSIAGE